MKNRQIEIVSLDEIIAFSKHKESPKVVIVDSITDDEVEDLGQQLKLLFFRIEKSNMLAFIDNADVVLALAKRLNKKAQLMFYDYSKRPNIPIPLYSLTGVCSDWNIIRDNGYVVKAFSETGIEIKQWINTDIKEIETPTLNKYGLKKYNVSLSIKGCNRFNTDILLQLSRYHFINGGVFNAKRNCYYPRDTSSNKRISRT